MEYDSDSSVEYIGELVASRSLSIAQVTSKGKRRDEEQTRAPRKSGSSEQNRKSVSAASGAEHRTNKVVGLRPPAGGSNGGGGRNVPSWLPIPSRSCTTSKSSIKTPN